MKRLIVSNACRKDIRQLKKRGHRFEVFYYIIECLKTEKPIPEKHRTHKLKGKWSGYNECHVRPDWLLIWREDTESVKLIRTGSHSDLFK